MLWDLFITFFVIGSVSFGGGYAMIPVIEREVVQNHGWMTIQQFTDAIAIAGMSPGPIAANSAIFIGYQVAGLAGATLAAIGMVLPSLILITFIAGFFYKMRKNPVFRSVFYGLRPIITGLIIFAAVRFAFKNGVISFNLSAHMFMMLFIFSVSLFVLLKYRWHPALVIIASGLFGMIVFSI